MIGPLHICDISELDFVLLTFLLCIFSLSYLIDHYRILGFLQNPALPCSYPTNHCLKLLIQILIFKNNVLPLPHFFFFTVANFLVTCWILKVKSISVP